MANWKPSLPVIVSVVVAIIIVALFQYFFTDKVVVLADGNVGAIKTIRKKPSATTSGAAA